MESIQEKNEQVVIGVVGKFNKTAIDFKKKAEAIVKDLNTNLETVLASTELAKEDYETLLENIAIKERDLKELTEEYAKKKREAEYELGMASKENGKLVLAKLAQENEMELYAKGVVGDLQQQLADVTAKFEALETQNEEDIEKQIKAKLDNQKSFSALTHKADIAEKDAEIKSLQSQLQASQAQVQQLNETLAAERERSIEIAKAQGGEKVVINQGK